MLVRMCFESGKGAMTRAINFDNQHAVALVSLFRNQKGLQVSFDKESVILTGPNVGQSVDLPGATVFWFRYLYDSGDQVGLVVESIDEAKMLVEILLAESKASGRRFYDCQKSGVRKVSGFGPIGEVEIYVMKGEEEG